MLPAPRHTLLEDLQRAKGDDRGAVMVLGVFLAIFLIGALFFLMGIGESLVFRDKAQEAADAASFSVSVVHAKGMNLIAVLNMLLVLMTLLYLSLGVLRDVAYIAYIAACYTPIVVVPGACTSAKKAMDTAHHAWTSYARTLRVSTEAVGQTQTITAYVAPHLGQVAGISVGKMHTYDGDGFLALSISPSMIPGRGDGGRSEDDRDAKVSVSKDISGEFSFSEAPGKLGLPVEKAENSMLCVAAGQSLKNAVNEAVRGSFGIFSRAVIAMIKGYLVPRYCGDLVNHPILTFFGEYPNQETPEDWWLKKHVKRHFRPAVNGSEWLQTYTFVLGSYKDASAPKVALAAMDLRERAEPTWYGYVAQSEIFFDCGGRWTDEDCNGDDNDIDFALFRANWRARLVRVRKIGLLSELLSFFRGRVLGGGIFKDLGAIAPSSFTDDADHRIQRASAKAKDAAEDVAGPAAGTFLEDLLESDAQGERNYH